MNIQVGDFIRFLTVRKGLSDSSVRLVKIRFEIIERFLRENNLPLSKDSVEEFFYQLKKKGFKNNTLNTYVFTFRYIQEYLKDRGKESSFFDGFESFKKNKSVIEILTPEEVERLLNTNLEFGSFRGKDCQFLDEIYKTLMMFLAFTGSRFDETTSLRVKHLDLSAGKARFENTKNKEIHHVYFTEPLISRLSELIEGKGNDDLVFTNVMGKKIHPQDFVVTLKERAEKAGIRKRVYPHLFRHSFATHLLTSGVDITLVASLLNHKDIQTTFNNYVHLADESLKKATFRHPLVRKRVKPLEILRQIRDAILNYKIDEDERFFYKLEESENSLQLTIFVK